jgi:hypothetical protein
MSHVAVAAHGIVWGRNQGPFRPKLLATALKIKKTEVFGSLSLPPKKDLLTVVELLHLG